MAFPAVGHHCPLFGTKLLGDRGPCVSNLPKVVVGTWIDRESKPRESQRPNDYRNGSQEAVGFAR